MKAKRYFRTSLDSLFYQVVTLAALSGAAYILILVPGIDHSAWTSRDWVISVVIYVFVALSCPVLAYLLSTFWTGSIRLDDKRIRNRGDNRLPREKIQYPASVDYEDIVKIEIAPLRRNSKNGYLRLARPIPYLRIKRQNGETALFALHFMSRGTVRRLLADLQSRLAPLEHGASINVSQLLDDFSRARWATKE